MPTSNRVYELRKKAAQKRIAEGRAKEGDQILSSGGNYKSEQIKANPNESLQRFAKNPDLLAPNTDPNYENFVKDQANQRRDLPEGMITVSAEEWHDTKKRAIAADKAKKQERGQQNMFQNQRNANQQSATEHQNRKSSEGFGTEKNNQSSAENSAENPTQNSAADSAEEDRTPGKIDSTKTTQTRLEQEALAEKQAEIDKQREEFARDLAEKKKQYEQQLRAEAAKAETAEAAERYIAAGLARWDESEGNQIADFDRLADQSLEDLQSQIDSGNFVSLAQIEQEQEDELTREIMELGQADSISEARAMARKQISGSKTEAERDAEIEDLLDARIFSAESSVSQEQIFEVAAQAWEGNVLKAEKYLKEKGVPVSYIDQAKEDYQVNVLKFDPELVKEKTKLQKLSEAQKMVLSGADESGLDILGVLGQFGEYGEAEEAFQMAFLDQVIESPTTNAQQKFHARVYRNSLEEKNQTKKDIRGSIKTGFVEITSDGQVITLSSPKKSTDGFGSSQAVNDWAESIMDGTAKISNVPEEFRNATNAKVREFLASGKKIQNASLTDAQLKTADKIAKDLSSNPNYKNTLDVTNGFDTVLALFGTEQLRSNSTGFDDVTAINAFQRMIDPGATVREGDVELLRTTVPYLKKISPEYKWSQFKKGDVLPPEIRGSLLQVARQVYDTKVTKFNSTTGLRFKKRAEAGGIDYDYIGSDFIESGELIAQLEENMVPVENSPQFSAEISDEELKAKYEAEYGSTESDETPYTDSDRQDAIAYYQAQGIENPSEEDINWLLNGQ